MLACSFLTAFLQLHLTRVPPLHQPPSSSLDTIPLLSRLFLPTFVFLRTLSCSSEASVPSWEKNQNKNGHRACEKRPCNDPCWLLQFRGSAHIFVRILGILVGQPFFAIFSRIPRGESRLSRGIRSLFMSRLREWTVLSIFREEVSRRIREKEREREICGDWDWWFYGGSTWDEISW